MPRSKLDTSAFFSSSIRSSCFFLSMSSSAVDLSVWKRWAISYTSLKSSLLKDLTSSRNCSYFSTATFYYSIRFFFEQRISYYFLLRSISLARYSFSSRSLAMFWSQLRMTFALLSKKVAYWIRLCCNLWSSSRSSASRVWNSNSC